MVSKSNCDLCPPVEDRNSTAAGFASALTRSRNESSSLGGTQMIDESSLELIIALKLVLLPAAIPILHQAWQSTISKAAWVSCDLESDAGAQEDFEVHVRVSRSN